MRSNRGFTLLELVVAVAILAVMAAIAYGGLNTLIAQYESTADTARRTAELHRTMGMLAQDLYQVQPRPVRDAFHGDPLPEFVAGPTHDDVTEFTRGGWSNPALRGRASLQRVAWRLRDGTLERLHWTVLDRAPGAEPVVTPMLGGVVRLEWRFMDDAEEWRDIWPPPGITGRPRAVEVALVFEDGTGLSRVLTTHGG